MSDEDRYLVIDGRRWRRTDPDIPETLRVQLVRVLMTGRRRVGAAKRAADDDAIAAARRSVHDAKVALGERGDPWWEDPTTDGLEERIDASIRTLLRGRDPVATICPSEPARVVGGDGWRDHMDRVRESAARLAADEIVDVRKSGVPTDPAAAGAVRIGRGTRFTYD